ncbi:hypothetical protein NODU109028_10080 [Nocardioides dubius]|uniref:Uncharacterized protein n=1 Tax=Nocardioides dubius TaxID=317019 RepID=A0ABP4E964_9ACTN
MDAFYLEIAMRVSGGAEGLEQYLDHVLEQLLVDDRATDPDYVASLADGRVEFALTVTAPDQGEALAEAIEIVHTALRAAEAEGPGWESRFQETQSLVRSAVA